MQTSNGGENSGRGMWHGGTPAAVVVALAVILTSRLAAGEEFSAAKSEIESGHSLRGESTRSAFAAVTKAARTWTVEVQADDRPVALGVVVYSDGLILTKASEVVVGRLTVRLSDGRVLPANRLVDQRSHDLALLRVDAQGLSTVVWATSADLAVGRWVITPNPDELPLAVGIVSAERREIPAQKVPGVLGIESQMANEQLRIQKVLSECGASRAGLRVDDLIESVSQQSVPRTETLEQIVAQHDAGDVLNMTVRRGKESLDIAVQLDQPAAADLPRSARLRQMGGALSNRRNGFSMVLQHDTVLKPADCGGPLLDLTGKAVGINIARAERTRSFALPADIVQATLTEMLKGLPPQ